MAAGRIFAICADELDQIQATFMVPGGCGGVNSSTVVAGTFVRTTVSVFGCFVGPPPFTVPLQTVFGPLPAKVYIYEIYESYEGGAPVLRLQQPLIVTAAPASIPAASGSSLVALMLMLAVVALRAISH